jgi:15-cis-phytoene synthase
MKALQPKTDRQIFRSSTTFYASAKFFPRRLRRDIEKLYSFLRVADDLVDRVPQDKETFKNLVSHWEHYRHLSMAELKPEPSDSLNVRVVKNICQLVIIHQIEQMWVDTFLETMRSELRSNRSFKTLNDVFEYIQGSGEMVALMMARILGVPPKKYETARLQGRILQYVNFIRDIPEDTAMGRCYFAAKEMKEFNLSKLTEEEANAHPDSFKKFIRAQLKRCKDWQYQVDKDLFELSRDIRVPVLTAADSYRWTAKRIHRNPFIIFKKKIKPSKARIRLIGTSHLLD